MDKTSKVLVAMGLVLFVFFAAYSLNKPIMTDEVNMAGPGVSIARYGQPIYYHGEYPEQYVPEKDLWQVREAPRPNHEWALMHPPLIFYCFSWACRLFGTGAWAFRMVGLTCYLLNLLLGWGILRQILPVEKANRVFGPFAFLYLINPLLLQQGLMLDIDNTILTTASLLYLHEFLRLERRGSGWLLKYAWLTALMVLSFWIKEFGGLYLVLTVVLFLVLQRRWQDAAGAMLSGVVGAALFWGTWWVYCQVTGAPLLYWIRFTILGKLAIGEGLLSTMVREAGWANALFSVWFSILHTALWTSPFYFGLMLFVIGWRVREAIVRRGVGPLDLLLLYVLVVFGVAQVYRPSGWFLKYGYPMHGLFLLLLGVYLHEKFGTRSVRELAILGLSVVVVAFAQVVVTDDPVYWLFQFGFAGLRNHHVWAFYGISAVVLVIALKLARPRFTPTQIAAGALVVGLAGANLGLAWRQRDPFATSISWNNYGEAEFREAAEYLKSVVPADKQWISRFDFGFYIYKDLNPPYRKWVNGPVLTNWRTPQELVQTITAPEVSHIVLCRYSIRRDALPIISRYYDLDRQFGPIRGSQQHSFYILRRKNQSE